MNPNDLEQKEQQEYKCLICDFNTYKKNNYNRHLETRKHKTREILQNPNDLEQKEHRFDCECGKSYKHKPTLYAHKKKCKLENEDKLITYDENNLNYKDMFLQLLQKTDTLHNLIIEQNKIIQEKDKTINEKDKTINEIIPKIGNTNSNNNINSHNKNINIQLFLNENCKDALSMDEFVKKIQISLTDLLFTKQKGIVNGISNIFIKNLNDLPHKKRPIWCSDKKRKKLFIKDKEWTEDVDNIKTKQAIKDVSAIQVKNINKYTEKYPDWKEKENKKEEYISIVKNTTSDVTEKNEDIINKLVESIYLDNESKKILNKISSEN